MSVLFPDLQKGLYTRLFSAGYIRVDQWWKETDLSPLAAQNSSSVVTVTRGMDSSVLEWCRAVAGNGSCTKIGTEPSGAQGLVRLTSSPHVAIQSLGIHVAGMAQRRTRNSPRERS